MPHKRVDRLVLWAKVFKRTAQECARVALAKLGHDPCGMLLKDRPWGEVVRRTYVAHRDWLIGGGNNAA